ncbi:unnamed protein product [Somion occarium]|uniref:25S rRNA (uridine-N(3))-methyltransferase BMT5-like domain-containing protein n=1 Tax=Somion occarium TaxID=3059160 RepID=A0ABP1CFE8_9APHY
MAKGRKTSLKAALSSQQSRLKKKQDAAHAAQHAEQQGKHAKVAQAKGKGKAVPRAPTIPFTATDRILLIGEGNFSFARALTVEPPAALEYLPARNITATAYDSEDDCYAKYPDAHAIVTVLRQKGAEVIFGVDATKLEKYPALRGRNFDKIVWNFPHAGKGITDQDRNILSNQLLLLGFLRSAASFLTTGPVPVVVKKKKPKSGESEDEGQDSASEAGTSNSVAPRGSILITLRNVTPYTLWSVFEFIFISTTRLTLYVGICPSLLKARHLRNKQMSLRILDTSS